MGGGEPFTVTFSSTVTFLPFSESPLALGVVQKSFRSLQKSDSPGFHHPRVCRTFRALSLFLTGGWYCHFLGQFRAKHGCLLRRNLPGNFSPPPSRPWCG